jgi:hypothetical protein
MAPPKLTLMPMRMQTRDSTKNSHPGLVDLSPKKAGKAQERQPTTEEMAAQEARRTAAEEKLQALRKDRHHQDQVLESSHRKERATNEINGKFMSLYAHQFHTSINLTAALAISGLKITNNDPVKRPSQKVKQSKANEEDFFVSNKENTGILFIVKLHAYMHVTYHH